MHTPLIVQEPWKHTSPSQQGSVEWPHDAHWPAKQICPRAQASSSVETSQSLSIPSHGISLASQVPPSALPASGSLVPPSGSEPSATPTSPREKWSTSAVASLTEISVSSDSNP